MPAMPDPEDPPMTKKKPAAKKKTVPRTKSQESSEEEATPRKTHFAIWRNGIYIRSTPGAFAAAVRDIESRNGPAWIKGISRTPGEYQPLP